MSVNKQNESENRNDKPRFGLAAIFAIAVMGVFAWHDHQQQQAINHVYDNGLSNEEAIEYLDENGFSRVDAIKYPACLEHYTGKQTEETVTAKGMQIKGFIRNCMR